VPFLESGDRSSTRLSPGNPADDGVVSACSPNPRILDGICCIGRSSSCYRCIAREVALRKYILGRVVSYRPSATVTSWVRYDTDNRYRMIGIRYRREDRGGDVSRGAVWSALAGVPTDLPAGCWLARRCTGELVSGKVAETYRSNPVAGRESADRPSVLEGTRAGTVIARIVRLFGGGQSGSGSSGAQRRSGARRLPAAF
jgi:hypothetical protein